MILRYTLNNATEGEHITTYAPKGWQETELVLSRHEKYEGIFKDYTVKVDFFCGAGKEYIDNIYDTQGIEAEVDILIEMDCNESGEYETLYDGQLIMKSYEIIRAAPEYTRVNLEQSGIIQTVLNRIETKIDLTKTETLDGTAVTSLTYAPYDLTTHSKEIIATIRVEALASPYSEVTSPAIGDDDLFVTLPFDAITIQEFLQANTIPSPYITNGAGPPSVNGWYTNTNDEDVELSIEYDFQGTFEELLPTQSRDYNLALVYRISNDNDPTTGFVILQDYGPKSTAGDITMSQDISLSGTLTLTVPSGYSVFVYFILSEYSYSSVLLLPCTITMNFTSAVINATINSTTDSTITKSFAIFETGADIARKITNQADAFRSNYFGRKNSQPYAYDENGCGSFTAFTNGFQLRGFPIADRPVYMSMREYFDGLNAIHCLGLGVKQDGENTYIEVEPKEYFYRNDEVVLTLNNVRGLKTILDQRYFFSRFKIGFKDWRKEGLNGLDEFCTTHEYATLLKSVNNELVAQSEFIAGPYALERQRRQRYTETQSTDEDYDNKNFIIALNRSVDGSGIPNNLDEAEKDENFTNIDNLFSPETVYNLRFSPARSARNWYKILSTSLIKLNDTLKNVKFSFAEGNKTMESEGTEICDPGHQGLINEGNDLVISVPGSSNDLEPLFTGEIDTIEDYPLSFASYLHLKDLDDNGVPNYYKMIRYSTGESDYLFGFVDELRYKPITGKASFRFRRAYNQDMDCTHIYVEAGYVECGYVE